MNMLVLNHKSLYNSYNVISSHKNTILISSYGLMAYFLEIK